MQKFLKLLPRRPNRIQINILINSRTRLETDLLSTKGSEIWQTLQKMTSAKCVVLPCDPSATPKVSLACKDR